MPETPVRIQRRRVPGWRAPEGAVYVGRGSRFGNPFAIIPEGRQWRVIDTGDRSRSLREEPQIVPEAHYARLMATRLFELHTGPMGIYEYDPDDLAEIRRVLGGRDLMCWCPLPEPGETDHCHAAVLLRLANAAAGVRWTDADSEVR